ncbi:MAG: riboflavin biosynthesis protein RibF [Ruminococcus sp.]|nr:riboflavin biosynthesis protein RibF [Ruminococcus sp.]
MEIINESLTTPTAAALGIFDGLHLGHKRVLSLALEVAKSEGLAPAVFTFKSQSITTKGDFRTLLTEDEKLKRLEGMGFEYVYSAHFSRLRDLSDEEFVDKILVGLMNVKTVVCGENFHFGRGGKADVGRLKELCSERGASVLSVPLLRLDDEDVSSTLIRLALENGEIARANALLGYRYGYTLKIEHGFERGRTWDFPTINQALPDGCVLPKFGVYCSRVLINGTWYSGVTNIGVKPTVEQKQKPLAETYILDYSGDLYGKEITIELYEFVRSERKFNSIDELKAEIARNILFTRKYFESAD